MAKYDYKKLAKQKKYSEKELNALKNHMNANPVVGSALNNFVANKEGTKLDKTQVAKGFKYLVQVWNIL